MLGKTWLGLAAGVSSLLCVSPAQAQDFYLGQILMVGYNFCPRGTAEANGAVIAITSNTALFSLLGTTYGGNGQTTFGLPDLRSRVPNSWGQGPGLANYNLGQVGGAESTTLTSNQMAIHTHPGWSVATNVAPNTDDPTNASPASFPVGNPIYSVAASPTVAMASGTVTLNPAGGSQPFSNLAPYLTIRFCIVTEGLFPPRS